MPQGASFCASLRDLLALIFLALPTAAHAHVDAVTGQDYRMYFRNDGRGSCCDWHDCRPAFQPFMEPDGEKIVDFGNNKYGFDRSKLVSRPSEDGNWHVCGDGRKLNCIIAPAQSRLDPGRGYPSAVRLSVTGLCSSAFRATLNAIRRPAVTFAWHSRGPSV